MLESEENQAPFVRDESENPSPASRPARLEVSYRLTAEEARQAVWWAYC